jgi:hypothetical protein
LIIVDNPNQDDFQMRIKPRQTLTGLTAIWAAFALLECASSLLRRWYSRNMGGFGRAVSGAVGFWKMALMIILAVSNAALFLKHVDDVRGGDDDNKG